MAVGYDSSHLRSSRFTYSYTKQCLAQAHAHARDYAWLDRHAEEVHNAIHRSLVGHGELVHDAVQTLLSLSRYLMSRADYKRWWQLFFEAFNEVSKLRDHVLLQEINTYLGTGYLLNGDVVRARHLFAAVINQASNDPMTDAQVMLAYIGLIKVETWDYSGHFTPEVVEAALALSNRLSDRLLTDLLYQALASAYSHRGATAEAIGYAMTALGYAYARNDRLNAAMTGIILATAYRKVGLIGRAERTLGFVDAQLAHVEHPQAAALAAYERGVIDYYHRDFASARRWVTQAFHAFRALEWTRQVTMALHMLGNLATEIGQFEVAEGRLLRTLSLWRELDHRYEQASVLYDLSELYRRWGLLPAARERLAEAAAVCQAIPPMASREWLIELIVALQAKLS